MRLNQSGIRLSLITIAAASLGMFAASCSDDSHNNNQGSGNCGNQVVDGNEVCDGSIPDSVTCESEVGTGYQGTVSCKSDCSGYDTSDCSKKNDGNDKDPNGNDKDPNGNDKDPNGNDKDPNGNDKDPNGNDKDPNENDKDPNEPGDPGKILHVAMGSSMAMKIVNPAIRCHVLNTCWMTIMQAMSSATTVDGMILPVSCSKDAAMAA